MLAARNDWLGSCEGAGTQPAEELPDQSRCPADGHLVVITVSIDEGGMLPPTDCGL